MPPTFSSFTQVFSSDFLHNFIYLNMLEMATSKEQRLSHLNHNNSKHDLRHYLNNNKDKASDKKYAIKTEEAYYKRDENRQKPIKRDDRGKDSPSNWSEHMSRTGRIYYYNSQTEVSQWEKPNILVERESYSRMKANRLSAKRILEHEYVSTDHRISDKHEGSNQKASCNTLYGTAPNHHSRSECNKQQSSSNSKLNFEHSRPLNDHPKTSNTKYYNRNDTNDSTTTTLNNNKRKEFDTKDNVSSFIKHGSGDDRIRSETFKNVSSREDIDVKRRNKRLNTLDVVSRQVNSNAYDSNDVADDGSSISMDIEKEDSQSPKLNLQKALTNLHNAIMLSHSKNSPQNETKPRKSSQYQSVSKYEETPLNSSHVRRHTLEHHVQVKHNGHTKKVSDHDLFPSQSHKLSPLSYHCEETYKRHKDKVAAVLTEEKSPYKDGDLISPPPLTHHKTADEIDHDDDMNECNDGTTSSLLSFQASSPTSISSVSSSPASLHDAPLPDEDTTKVKDLLSNKSPHRSKTATKKIQKSNKLDSQHDISLLEEDIESISSPDDVFIASSSLSSPLTTAPTIESNDFPGAHQKSIGDKKILKHETTVTAIKSETKDDGEDAVSKTIILTKTQNGLPVSNLMNEYETKLIVENYESIDKNSYLPDKQHTAFSQCFLKKSYLAQISTKPLATINQIESKYIWSTLTNEKKDFMVTYSNLCYKSATDIQDKLSLSTKNINEEIFSDIQPSTIDIKSHDLRGALCYLYADECDLITNDDFQKEFNIQTEQPDYICADGIKNDISYETLPQIKCNIPAIENNTEIDLLKDWDANDLEIKSNAIFGETGFIHAKSLCNYGTDILGLLADTQLLAIKKDLKTYKLNGLDSISKTIQEMKIEKSK